MNQYASNYATQTIILTCENIADMIYVQCVYVESEK